MHRIPLITILAFLYIAHFLFAEPIQITLSSGETWQGEIGQIVTVEFNNDSQKRETVEGELSRATDDYIMVGKNNFIFIENVVGLKSNNETSDSGSPKKPDGEERIRTRAGWLYLSQRLKQIGQRKEETTRCYIIPLEGKIGFNFGVDKLGSTNWFNRHVFESLIKTVKRSHADIKIIYFNIDSNGGMSDERNAICEIIQEYREDIEFIAYTHNALDEASTIAMTCDSLIAAPDAKIGATREEDEEDISKIKAHFENAGHPEAIALAFTKKAASLWQSTKTAEIDASPPNLEDWQEIDDAQTMPIFDATQLVRIGLAETEASEIETPCEKANDWSATGTNKYGKTQLTIIREQKILNKTLLELEETTEEIYDLLCDIFDCDGRCDHMCRQIDSKKWPVQNQKRITLKGTELRRAINDAQKTAARILEWHRKGKYEFHIDPAVIEYLETIKAAGDSILIERQILDNFPHCKNVIETLKDDLRGMWSPTP